MEDFNPLNEIMQQFPFLTQEDLMALISLIELRPVSQGEVLVRAGDMSYYNFRVIKGVLRNYMITSAGEERTILFSHEGKFTGAYACFLKGEPATENIDVIESGFVGMMDMRKFKELAVSNNNIMQVYNSGLSQNLMEAIERMEDYTILTNEERFIRFRERYPELLQRIPQKYLASYFGVTPVTLSRIKSRVLKKAY